MLSKSLSYINNKKKKIRSNEIRLQLPLLFVYFPFSLHSVAVRSSLILSLKSQKVELKI
jgi:hypothetical protein